MNKHHHITRASVVSGKEDKIQEGAQTNRNIRTLLITYQRDASLQKKHFLIEDLLGK
jgi:hypothetical protein